MNSKQILAWGGVILAAVMATSLIAPLPAQDSYCSECGARLQTYGARLRFTSRTLFRAQRTEPTPFSTMLERKHLVAAHHHQWVAPRLAADPLNEFGPPVLQSLAFINAPRVVNFSANVADYADPVSAAQWKQLVLEPRYTPVIDAALRFMRVPPSGFADRAAFLTWWGEHSYAVYNRIREVTEPD